MQRREAGQRAEAHAEKYLLQRGLTTLNKNYQCRFGELDLIMQDGEELVFVEVRQRSRSAFGSAADSITTHKQRRLTTTAKHYLTKHSRGLNQYCRFDVISIDGDLTTGHVNWIKNAFSE